MCVFWEVISILSTISEEERLPEVSNVFDDLEDFETKSRRGSVFGRLINAPLTQALFQPVFNLNLMQENDPEMALEVVENS